MGLQLYEASVAMANAITRMITWLQGEKVGEDQCGNGYYHARNSADGARRRRWVVYANGPDEASRVPADFHAWLHYTSNDFPSKDSPKKYPWLRDHQENMTGTPDAYRPPGQTLQGGRRDSATGDYESWSPE